MSAFGDGDVLGDQVTRLSRAISYRRARRAERTADAEWVALLAQFRAEAARDDNGGDDAA